MRPVYIASCGDYVEPIESDDSAVDLKGFVADAVGSPVRRIGRFIQLALIGAGRCARQVALPPDAAVFLGSGRGDLEVAMEVLQSIVRDGRAPKPLSFVNTVSNAACFYVAQSLKLTSQSTFVCNRFFALETMLQLAKLDLERGDLDNALVGTVDVVVPPLAAHRMRLGLDAETPVADASHWLLLQTRASSAMRGRLLAVEHFPDMEALRAWLAEQAVDARWKLATGQFMPRAEADEWQRALGLEDFDYLTGRPYYDSQSGAAIGEFLRREKGTLLHLNRDPSGRYQAMLVAVES